MLETVETNGGEKGTCSKEDRDPKVAKPTEKRPPGSLHQPKDKVGGEETYVEVLEPSHRSPCRKERKQVGDRVQ